MRFVIHVLAILLILIGFAGCSKNPGAMSKSGIESNLKKNLKLKDVSLTEDPGGGYKGTGTAEDGTNYQLTVTQDENEKTLNFKAISEKGVAKIGTLKGY